MLEGGLSIRPEDHMHYLQTPNTEFAALGRVVTQLQPYCLGSFLRDVSVLSLDQLRILMLEGGLSMRPKDQMHYLQNLTTESRALGRDWHSTSTILSRQLFARCEWLFIRPAKDLYMSEGGLSIGSNDYMRYFLTLTPILRFNVVMLLNFNHTVLAAFCAK